MTLYAVALRFPFTGTKGPCPTMKNSLSPLFLFHQTLQLSLCIRAGSVCHPPNPDSSVGLADGKAWFITPENAFPLLQSPMAASFTPLQPTLGIRLVWGCFAMKTHFMKLPTNSSSADVASRGSLELGSECCNWGQMIFTCFSAQLSRSVRLCGLPPRGWAVVAPRRFHFTITTLDQGSSSRAEMGRTDLLERWHPMTVPRWKSLSSSVRPIYCQCFVYGDCMAVGLILYTCQQWAWLK